MAPLKSDLEFAHIPFSCTSVDKFSGQRKYIKDKNLKLQIKEILFNIREVTEKEMAGPVLIASIGYPQHIHNKLYYGTLSNTAREVYPEITDALQLRSYLKVI